MAIRGRFGYWDSLSSPRFSMRASKSAALKWMAGILNRRRSSHQLEM
jgi:hypothetical protein